MKNRIALKLTLYFSALLLLLTLIIGGVFYQIFKEHTIEIKKQEMLQRAEKIADVISDNMNRLERQYGTGISNSRFITYLDNVTQDIVWVVDSERNLNINPDAMKYQRERRERLEHERSWLEKKLHHTDYVKPHRKIRPRTPKEAYEFMPVTVKEKVEECFKNGESFVLEEYNPMFDAIMLTVAEPVFDTGGKIKAVLLLHSPVEGLQAAVWAGLRILLVSMLAALGLSMLLAVVLSWRFTRPVNLMKNIAERLAERDYNARSQIKQHDEIGELAKTLDLLADRLQLADAESQKLEKLRREFIANISHELRTPVTVIRGSLEALRDGVVTDAGDVQEFHEQMYKESLFLQRLINDLLDLSRLQNSDNLPVDKTVLNIADVINDAVRSSRQIGKDKHIKINGVVDKDVYLLYGDYGRLRQMLMIFLHNSIKFSPENSMIEVLLQENKLQVVDHGCGINAEDIPYAFDRFYKARNEHNKEGSGLGLAIAKQIALCHDMHLEIKSIVGEGTVITIFLPSEIEVREQTDEK